MHGEATFPYLRRLLAITMNNNAIPGDWKKAIVVPIYKEEDRSAVGNYRPIKLNGIHPHVFKDKIRGWADKFCLHVNRK